MAQRPVVSIEEWLVGGGELGALIREKDWSTTPLGPAESWPQSLRSAVSILLPSRAQICLFWGPELVAIYNDAYRPTLGLKHPWALGRPARDVWSEFWDDVLRPLLQGVLDTGDALWASDYPFFLERRGYPEETYYDISYDPVRDESGRVGGIFCIVSETSGRVFGERRLRVLRDLGRIAIDVRSVDDVFQQAAAALESCPNDVAFAGLYDADGRRVAACRLNEGSHSWPFDEARSNGELVLQGDLLRPFGKLSGGTWPEPARAVIILPLMVPNRGLEGYLVLGTSPRLELDESYRNFLRLVAGSLVSALGTARALEEQKARAEALAALDRAKTAFFSNISHEFRTPLTLMLGPLEELLVESPGVLEPSDRDRIEVVRRNAIRLQKLVNTLLDFSRIEAGRANATYAPTDVATFTAELVSNFESACQKANISLRIECPPLPPVAWVDAASWEKIVLNLVSNALKFTFEGEIAVSVREDGDRIELLVRDSGIGIREEELPRLFERFHRVQGAHGRTHEGSGIGLALVHELVRLHGGNITVESAPGKGTSFRVWIPKGVAHLPPEKLADRAEQSDSAARAFAEESASWLVPSEPAPGALPAVGADARILVVDDNADMRGYLTRLLRAHWDVTAVSNGAAALGALETQAYDVVVSDIMMPEMDGFELLRAIRTRQADDVGTRVVLVSARAGEESRLEGIEAGADDYIVKPFSAAQLVAQVRAQVSVRHARLESERERNRLLAAERLARQEAELQRQHLVSLFSVAPNPIVILRGPEYIVDLANRATCRAWGKREEEVLGRPLLEVLPELKGQAIPDFLDDVLRTGIPYEGKEVPTALSRADGSTSTIYFNFVYTPLRNTDGGIDGILVTAFDVTDEVIARRDMGRLQTEAEAASRAKDEFLAVLSHELRNPLAPIVTTLRLLRMRGDNSREIDLLERQAAHLTRLVDDLLDVSRITRRRIELRLRPLELSAVIDRALEIASPLLEERQQLVDTSAVVRTGLMVLADPDRLAQVISNLLTNAAKYSERGSKITISAGPAAAGTVELSVCDQGIGIPAEQLNRVFDLFFQQPQSMERSRGGLGLGLAIVRHLVDLHGGRVKVRSDGLGTGSEFTVELPLANAADSHEPPPKSVRKLPTPRRVLVVDDNRDAADSLASLLRHLGHEVDIAHDGPSGLAAAQMHAPEFAFIDIGLPGIDGYELAARFRQVTPTHNQTSLIALTGYGLPTDRKRSRMAGFVQHLVKPVDVSALEAILAERGQTDSASQPDR